MADVLILLAVLAVGALGWREGFVRAVWGYTGLMAGTALGILVVPALLRDAGLSVWVSILALAVVGSCAIGVRFLAVATERKLSLAIRWSPNARLDRPAGLVFGVAVTLSVSWMIGLAVAGSSLPGLSTAANRSVVLRFVDGLHLPVSGFLVEQFSHLGEDVDFPRYVDVLTDEQIVDVAPGPDWVVDDPDVVLAAESVLRVVARDNPVTGSAGSGFLVAPERLMTAAHVVAGSGDILVDGPAGPLAATVVVCDPEQDVAVLAVPGLTGRVLGFGDAVAGDPAAVVGFPADGPPAVAPARVRERRAWQSADIWGRGRYEHDAYVVRAAIRTGHSGGPLVTADGRVLGVVVASSRQDPETGYVLTAQQVAATLELATSADSVAGDGCVP